MSLFLYTNVFVALCAAALVAATRAALGGDLSPGVLELHVWFATMCVYNIDRLVDEGDRIHASERHEWIAAHRRLLWVITAFSAVGTLVSMAMLPLDVVLGLAPLAVVSFLYSVPLFGTDFRLKSVAGTKTFVIAAVWAVVTVVLPALDVGVAVPEIMLLERFTFIFAITLPFEVRDARRDAAAGVSSLAHVLGARGAIGLAVGLLAATAAFALARNAIPVAISMFVPAASIVLALRPKSDWYYSLVLDGMMLVFAAVMLI